MLIRDDFMNPHTNEMNYNITQVADMTGLSKQVIRKWEERYGIVQPKRLDNGYRIYNKNEVSTLLYVKSLIDKGQTVKQAALQMKEKGTRTKESLFEKAESPKNESVHVNEHVRSLLSEGTLCHEHSMNRILHLAYHTNDMHTFLHQIVVPFLKEVGQRWRDGRWGEYQEALASLVVRDFLVQLRRNFQFDEAAPLLLGACLPNERHEIPLHIILLEVMLQGWRTVILGPSPAPNSIQSTVQQLNPEKVVLSAITSIPFDEDKQVLQELDQFASQHPHTQFYIGGPGIHSFIQDHTLQSIIVTNNMDDIFK